MRKRLFQSENGGNHGQIAESLDSLGVAYDGLGDHQMALELKSASLTMRNKLFSHLINHADIADSLRSMGATYEHIGNYKLAGEYYLKSLLMKRQLFDDWNPEIFELHNVLASVSEKENGESVGNK
jgi:tetratricopeptide (TPR) repeat protein